MEKKIYSRDFTPKQKDNMIILSLFTAYHIFPRIVKTYIRYILVMLSFMF